ncbi:BTB/POZ domain-containing protein 6-like [Oculina patagonica]
MSCNCRTWRRNTCCLHSLDDKCTEFLRDNLKAYNVLCIPPYAQKVEDEELENRCWKVTQRVDRWATEECSRQRLTPSDEHAKRRVLGDEIVNAIRYPLMTLIPRIGPFQRCRRIGKLVSVEEGGWYYHGSTNEIRFTVDKDVVFHGVQHFGSEEGKYEVSIKIKEPDDIFSRLTDPGFTEASGSYTSEKEENDEYYGFDVIFDHPVWLESAMKSVAPCRSSMISAHAPKEKKEEEKLEQEEEREE